MNSSNKLLNGANHTVCSQPVVRKRTRATAEQLAILEDTFAVNVSPNGKLRKQLAERLKMNERSIQIWFQNKRAKVKNMQKKAQMQQHQTTIRAQFYPYNTNGRHFYSSQYTSKQPSIESSYLKSSRVNFPTPEPSMPYGSQHTWLPCYTSPIITHNQHQQLEKKFLHLDHGPVSPTTSPNDKNPPSPTINRSTLQKCFSMPPTIHSTLENPIKTNTFSSSTLFHEPTDIWMPTPEADSYYGYPSISCYPSIPSSSLADPLESRNDSLNISILIIGTWQRMKYPGSDVSCFYEQDKFTWYIEEGGQRFKIEIPLAHIASIEYAIDAYVQLSQPPFFFMESNSHSWIQCSDFTESNQATQSLCHILKGPQLQQELSYLAREYTPLSKLIQT